MKEDSAPSSKHVSVNYFFIFTTLLIIAFSFYKYYYAKDFDYYVEASCNSETEECLERDCENDPDSCPPNGLSSYKAYYVKAYDFYKCSDVSCKEVCETGTITCEPISSL